MTEEQAAAVAVDLHLPVIVKDVFRVMAKIDLKPFVPEAFPAEDFLVATVQCVGRTQLYIEAACSRRLIGALTDRFLPPTAAYMRQDDMRDSAAELINIIGGNFKALLPDDTRLTIPEVLTIGSPAASLSTPQTAFHMWFTSDVGHCRIQILERQVPC